MNSRYNDDTDLNELNGQDREISLNTATILGIFFLLAIVCAVFFGFGYSIGRRTVQTAAPAADTSSTLASNGSAKPTPGSAAAQSTHKVESSTDEDAAPDTQSGQPATPAPSIQQVVQPLTRPAPATRELISAPDTVKPTPAPAAVPAAAIPAGPPALVQVAAVSHQEDADVLVNALKRRGYNVIVRHEPQDKLLHIQIGPLPNKKEAEAMRQKLLSDGYNAIVK